MTEPYVRLLGQLAIVDGAAISPINGAQQGMILARLALVEGRPIEATVLLDEMWKEGASIPVLHAAISRLRRQIPADSGLVVTTEGNSYALVGRGPHVSDIAMRRNRFARAVQLRTAGQNTDAEAVLVELVAGWGTPFGRFNGENALTIDGRQIEEEYQTVLDELTDLWIETGTASGHIAEIRHWAELAPYREGRWATLARAYYQGGRQQDALGALARYRELSIDVGLEAGPAIAELEDQIRNHLVRIPLANRVDDGAVDLAGPDGIDDDFVGRDADVDDVRRRFDSNRLVVLLGVHGVGCSRLAAAVALHVPGQVRSVRLVDLEFATSRDHAVELIAAAVDAPKVGAAFELDAVAGAVGDSDLLLVVDNAADPRLEIEGVLGQLLRACPSLRVLLVGSTTAAAMADAAVVSVDPLLVRLATGDPGPAVRLFLLRAGVTDDLDAGQIEVITRLCERLDGLPAAIEVAAARHPTVQPHEQLDQLGTRARRSDPVEEIVRQSIRALPGRERSLLVRLAPFRSGATVDDIGAVMNGKETTVAALTLVKRLEGLALVRRTRAAGLQRWVVRGAARRLIRLETPFDERAPAYRAHLERQVEVWSAARKPLLAGDREVVVRLGAAVPELRSALETSIELDELGLGRRLALLAERYWAQHGFIDEGLRWLTSLGVGEADDRGDGPLLMAAGELSALAGDLDRALDLYDRAEKAMIETNDPRVAMLWFDRGRARTAGVFRGVLDHSELEAAVDDHLAAVNLLTPEAGAEPSERQALALASILAFVVFTSILRGEDPDEPLERARSLAIVLDAPQIEAWVDAMEAFARYRAGDHVRAAELLARSADMLDTTADRWNLIIVTTLVAANESSMGHHDAALIAARESVALQQRWGNREWGTITIAVAWAVTRAALDALGTDPPESLMRAERLLDVCIANWDQPARYLNLPIPERTPAGVTMVADAVEAKVLPLLASTLAELAVGATT